MNKNFKEILQNLILFSGILIFLMSATVATQDITLFKPSKPINQTIIYVRLWHVSESKAQERLQKRLSYYTQKGFVIDKMTADNNGGHVIYLVKY